MFIDATARTITAPGSIGPWKRAEMAAGAFVAGYSRPRTREAYRLDLKAWFGFLSELGVTDPIGQVERSHFEVYMRRMEAKGNKDATRARRIGTPMVWYEWLVDEDYLVKSPARKVKRPSVSTTSTTPWLPTRQLADFLDAAEKIGGYTGPTCLILSFTAIRISELVNADVSDLEQIKHHYVLNVIRKGAKADVVTLPPRAMFSLHQALDGRQAGALILNQWGQRTTRECVQRAMDQVRLVAGIATRITPHGLRHSAITAGLDAGVPLRDMQLFAGHANSTTTTRYDRGGNSLDRNAAYTLSQVLAG